MQHEAISGFTHERIDELLVLAGTQGGDDQCLRLAPCKKQTYMGQRQNAKADINGAHGACIAAIDAWLTVKDLATYDFAFQIKDNAVYNVIIQRFVFAKFSIKLLKNSITHSIQCMGAGLFFMNFVG